MDRLSAALPSHHAQRIRSVQPHSALDRPRLAFHTLFGFTLLLFESGNLVLIYRLGNRLGEDSGTPMGQYGTTPIYPGLISAGIYALLFVPVYTLIGWFEPIPLFFMLLGLDLLLLNNAWGWSGSAVAAGLGFLTKLTPILLLPIAVRWLGAKLSWRAARDEWFKRSSPGNFRAPRSMCSFSPWSSSASAIHLCAPIHR